MKKIFYFLFFFNAITYIANSQPKTQKNSVRAVDNITIDGRATEWNDKYQARNPIDGISYTVSNDNKNLYLTLLAPYKDACEKVLRGGITFTTSKWIDKRRKNDAAKKSVTFPVLKIAQYLNVFSDFDEYLIYEKDTLKNKRKLDSLLNRINQKATTLFKIINIDGITFLVKSNPNIVASAQFNKKLDFVYELSVPLKYIGMDINYNKPFSYNITLKGETEEISNRKVNPNMPEPMLKPGVAAPPPASMDKFAPTDFWGEYVLAK